MTDFLPPPPHLKFAMANRDQIYGKSLEVGSMEVRNNSVRKVMPITIGVDLCKGPGVDQIVDVVNLVATFGAESFDCVVSTNSLEHMQDWDGALKNMWGVLKPGGTMFLTMASPSKGFHAYPHDYHRMSLESFLEMFRHNEIIASFCQHPSMGIIVIKRGDLDLTIRPYPVPPKRKKKKPRVKIKGTKTKISR